MMTRKNFVFIPSQVKVKFTLGDAMKVQRGS
jgi:hypothetical protein